MSPVPLNTQDAENVTEEVVAPEVADEIVDPAPELSREEKIAKATELFNAGKRLYISADYSGAADKLSESLQLSVYVHGIFAGECYDAHYLYGKVLIECSRMEEMVLNKALGGIPKKTEGDDTNDSVIGNPDELTEEERGEIREQVENALAENADEAEKKTESAKAETETKSEDEKPEESETKTNEPETMPDSKEKTDEAEAKTDVTDAKPDSDEKTDEAEAKTDVTDGADAKAESTVQGTTDASAADEAAPTSENSSATGKTASTSEEPSTAECEEKEQEEGEDEDGDEDDSDEDDDDAGTTYVQDAWEVLEVARKICDAQEASSEWDLKKADVLLALSDCSVIDENYKQAVDDISLAMEIQKKHLKPSDRILAQTYFAFARTNRLGEDFDVAAQYFQITKDTLQARLDEVKAADGEEDEVKELESLIKEINDEIVDSKESGEAMNKKINEVRKQLGLRDTNKLEEATSAPATDITNMIRKPSKRPADEADIIESKKAKAEEPASAPVEASS